MSQTAQYGGQTFSYNPSKQINTTRMQKYVTAILMALPYNITDSNYPAQL